MSLSLVACSFCNKTFFKDNRYINENIKLGHKFYCSRKYQYSAKNQKVEILCENPNCNKKFLRNRSKISFRNYCSRACYGLLVGLRNKSRNKSFKYCLYCGNRTSRQHTYCSPKCWGLNHQMPKEKIIYQLQELSCKLGRSPTKREYVSYSSCIRSFGAWTNALVAAGLTPHRSLSQRMYKRRKCFAKDGHICNSVSELIIDNWLYKHHIDHQKEVAYPKGKFISDWSLSNKIFVEYFGLANDSRRYDQEIKKKQQVCRDSGVRLIEIYSKDLFPKNKLENIFK